MRYLPPPPLCYSFRGVTGWWSGQGLREQIWRVGNGTSYQRLLACPVPLYSCAIHYTTPARRYLSKVHRRRQRADLICEYSAPCVPPQPSMPPSQAKASASPHHVHRLTVKSVDYIFGVLRIHTHIRTHTRINPPIEIQYYRNVTPPPPCPSATVIYMTAPARSLMGNRRIIDSSVRI